MFPRKKKIKSPNPHEDDRQKRALEVIDLLGVEVAREIAISELRKRRRKEKPS